MEEMGSPVLIYTTFATAEDAKRVGRELVQERVAACVNIIPSMTAIYEWEGELQEEAEVVTIIKTTKSSLRQAMTHTKEIHPYETPALLVLEPADADNDFAAWVAAQTGPAEKQV